MATIKSFTDIPQSKKLAEILPLESADMWWAYYYDVISDTGEYDKEPMLHKPVCDPDKALPCWSLAELLELLPYEIVLDEDESLILGIHKEDSQYYINYDNTYNGEIYFETLLYDDFVDACYEMIVKLKEQKLL